MGTKYLLCTLDLIFQVVEESKVEFLKILKSANTKLLKFSEF